MSDPQHLEAGTGARAQYLQRLLLLTLASSAAVFAKVSLTPVQESVRTALTLTDNQLGFLQGPALAWPMLLVAAPLGLMIDRWSRIWLLRITLLCLLAGSLLTTAASSYAMLFAARGLVGLGAFAMVPILSSLLADGFAPEARGRAGMVTMLGQFGAVSLAFALGGSLLAHFGAVGDGWRPAMFWLTGPALVIVTLALLAFREPRRHSVLAAPTPKAALETLFRLRSLVLPIVIGQIATIFALAGLMVWAASALGRSFGLSPDAVGAILAIAAPVGGIAGTVAGGVIADFCQKAGGPRLTLAVAALTVIASGPMAYFAMVSGPLLAGAMLGITIMLLTAAALLVATILIIVIPGEILGLTISLSAGVGALLAIGAAPIAVSSLTGVTGGSATIGLALGLVASSAALTAAGAFLVARSQVGGDRNDV
jgi:predicted MFS family arabinose efflux permease